MKVVLGTEAKGNLQKLKLNFLAIETNKNPISGQGK